MEEIVLVKLAKNKDKRAFIELINIIKKEIYLTAKIKLKDEKDIEEAIKNTILKNFKNIKRLHNNNMFKIWIMKNHINECNKIEKKKKNKEIYKEKNLIKNKKCEEIKFNTLIKNLNDEEKVILTLYYCFKYSVKEISEILRENENNINSKIIRSRNKIRNEIKTKNEKIIDIEKILRNSGNIEIKIPNKIEKIIEHTLDCLDRKMIFFLLSENRNNIPHIIRPTKVQ